MKDDIRVSLVQLECAWLDRERNVERMAEHVEREAAEHGADLVVFPELATTGYLPQALDAEYRQRLFAASEPIPGPTTRLLGEVAARHAVHVVAGVSELHPTIPHVLRNAAVLIGADGTVVGTYRKAHGSLDEKHLFANGNELGVFDTDLGRIALEICYDVRFPELARAQALAGAEVLVSIWAMFEQPGKAPNDSIVVRCRSRATENFVYVLGCNRTGSEGGRTFFGRSVVSAPSGEVLAKSESADEEEVVRAVLTDELFAAQRMYLPLFQDRRPDLYGSITDPL